MIGANLPLCDQAECTRDDHLIGYLRGRLDAAEDEAAGYHKLSSEQADESRKWRFRAERAESALEQIARWPAAGRAQELARKTLEHRP